MSRGLPGTHPLWQRGPTDEEATMRQSGTDHPKSARAARCAFILMALLCAGLIGCDDDADPADGPDAEASVGRAGLFGPDVRSLTIEVDYAPGAAPEVSYGGLLGGDRSPWDIFETNLVALYADAPPTLNIPRALDAMQALPADAFAADDFAADDNYTVDAILDLADEFRDTPSEATARSVYVIWLDGYYADDSGRRETVLGVSLGDTGVIAMFKPVIDSVGSTARVEQTTLVHEFGHAAGLVANGIMQVEDHHDAEHGAHCSNEDCVMYWTIESAAGVRDFVGAILGGDDPRVLFGAACLADAHAAGR